MGKRKRARKKSSRKRGSSPSKLSFYCVKGKHKVQSAVKRTARKKGRRFAIGHCDKHDIDMWRILGKD